MTRNDEGKSLITLRDIFDEIALQWPAVRQQADAKIVKPRQDVLQKTKSARWSEVSGPKSATETPTTDVEGASDEREGCSSPQNSEGEGDHSASFLSSSSRAASQAEVRANSLPNQLPQREEESSQEELEEVEVQVVASQPTAVRSNAPSSARATETQRGLQLRGLLRWAAYVVWETQSRPHLHLGFLLLAQARAVRVLERELGRREVRQGIERLTSVFEKRTDPPSSQEILRWSGKSAVGFAIGKKPKRLLVHLKEQKRRQRSVEAAGEEVLSRRTKEYRIVEQELRTVARQHRRADTSSASISAKAVDPFSRDAIIDPVTGRLAWCSAKLKAWKLRRVNANAFLYRFVCPGAKQTKEKWTPTEQKLFHQRLQLFRERGWRLGSCWGLFSLTIPTKVGYQCSNYFRSLIKNRRISDPSYALEGDKLVFVGADKSKAAAHDDELLDDFGMAFDRHWEEDDWKRTAERVEAYLAELEIDGTPELRSASARFVARESRASVARAARSLGVPDSDEENAEPLRDRIRRKRTLPEAVLSSQRVEQSLVPQRSSTQPDRRRKARRIAPDSDEESDVESLEESKGRVIQQTRTLERRRNTALDSLSVSTSGGESESTRATVLSQRHGHNHLGSLLNSEVEEMDIFEEIGLARNRLESGPSRPPRQRAEGEKKIISVVVERLRARQSDSVQNDEIREHGHRHEPLRQVESHLDDEVVVENAAIPVESEGHTTETECNAPWLEQQRTQDMVALSQTERKPYTSKRRKATPTRCVEKEGRLVRLVDVQQSGSASADGSATEPAGREGLAVEVSDSADPLPDWLDDEESDNSDIENDATREDSEQPVDSLNDTSLSQQRREEEEQGRLERARLAEELRRQAQVATYFSFRMREIAAYLSGQSLSLLIGGYSLASLGHLWSAVQNKGDREGVSVHNIARPLLPSSWVCWKMHCFSDVELSQVSNARDPFSLRVVQRQCCGLLQSYLRVVATMSGVDTVWGECQDEELARDGGNRDLLFWDETVLEKAGAINPGGGATESPPLSSVVTSLKRFLTCPNDPQELWKAFLLVLQSTSLDLDCLAMVCFETVPVTSSVVAGVWGQMGARETSASANGVQRAEARDLLLSALPCRVWETAAAALQTILLRCSTISLLGFSFFSRGPEEDSRSHFHDRQRNDVQSMATFLLCMIRAYGARLFSPTVEEVTTELEDEGKKQWKTVFKSLRTELLVSLFWALELLSESEPTMWNALQQSWRLTTVFFEQGGPILADAYAAIGHADRSPLRQSAASKGDATSAIPWAWMLHFCRASRALLQHSKVAGQQRLRRGWKDVCSWADVQSYAQLREGDANSVLTFNEVFAQTASVPIAGATLASLWEKIVSDETAPAFSSALLDSGVGFAPTDVVLWREVEPIPLSALHPLSALSEAPTNPFRSTIGVPNSSSSGRSNNATHSFLNRPIRRYFRLLHEALSNDQKMSLASLLLRRVVRPERTATALALLSSNDAARAAAQDRESQSLRQLARVSALSLVLASHFPHSLFKGFVKRFLAATEIREGHSSLATVRVVLDAWAGFCDVVNMRLGENGDREGQKAASEIRKHRDDVLAMFMKKLNDIETRLLSHRNPHADKDAAATAGVLEHGVRALHRLCVSRKAIPDGMETTILRGLPLQCLTKGDEFLTGNTKQLVVDILRRLLFTLSQELVANEEGDTSTALAETDTDDFDEFEALGQAEEMAKQKATLERFRKYQESSVQMLLDEKQLDHPLEALLRQQFGATQQQQQSATLSFVASHISAVSRAEGRAFGSGGGRGWQQHRHSWRRDGTPKDDRAQTARWRVAPSARVSSFGASGKTAREVVELLGRVFSVYVRGKGRLSMSNAERLTSPMDASKVEKIVCMSYGPESVYCSKPATAGQRLVPLQLFDAILTEDIKAFDLGIADWRQWKPLSVSILEEIVTVWITVALSAEKDLRTLGTVLSSLSSIVRKAQSSGVDMRNVRGVFFQSILPSLLLPQRLALNDTLPDNIIIFITLHWKQSLSNPPLVNPSSRAPSDRRNVLQRVAQILLQNMDITSRLLNDEREGRAFGGFRAGALDTGVANKRERTCRWYLSLVKTLCSQGGEALLEDGGLTAALLGEQKWLSFLRGPAVSRGGSAIAQPTNLLSIALQVHLERLRVYRKTAENPLVSGVGITAKHRTAIRDSCKALFYEEFDDSSISSAENRANAVSAVTTSSATLRLAEGPAKLGEFLGESVLPSPSRSGTPNSNIFMLLVNDEYLDGTFQFAAERMRDFLSRYAIGSGEDQRNALHYSSECSFASDTIVRLSVLLRSSWQKYVTGLSTEQLAGVYPQSMFTPTALSFCVAVIALPTFFPDESNSRSQWHSSALEAGTSVLRLLESLLVEGNRRKWCTEQTFLRPESERNEENSEADSENAPSLVNGVRTHTSDSGTGALQEAMLDRIKRLARTGQALSSCDSIACLAVSLLTTYEGSTIGCLRAITEGVGAERRLETVRMQAKYIVSTVDALLSIPSRAVSTTLHHSLRDFREQRHVGATITKRPRQLAVTDFCKVLRRTTSTAAELLRVRDAELQATMRLRSAFAFSEEAMRIVT